MSLGAHRLSKREAGLALGLGEARYVDALALEKALAGVPGKEDDDRELEPLSRCRHAEPVASVRRGDERLLADALRPDHDLRQCEVDVRKGGQQAVVELRRAG